MSIFSSAFESLMTAPGTNALRGQEDRKRAASRVLEGYLAEYGKDPAALAQRDMADEANTRQAMLSIFQTLARQSDPNAQADLFAGSARQSFNSASRRAAGAARGMGLDAATVAALAGGDPLQRQRAEAGARMAGRQQASTNQQNALQTLMGVLNLNQNRMGTIFNANAQIQGQTPVAVQPGFGDFLGQAAGAYIGGKSSSGRW